MKKPPISRGQVIIINTCNEWTECENKNYLDWVVAEYRDSNYKENKI